MFQGFNVFHLLRYLSDRLGCLHCRRDVMFLVKMDVIAPKYEQKKVKKNKNNLLFAILKKIKILLNMPRTSPVHICLLLHNY